MKAPKLNSSIKTERILKNVGSRTRTSHATINDLNENIFSTFRKSTDFVISKKRMKRDCATSQSTQMAPKHRKKSDRK